MFGFPTVGQIQEYWLDAWQRSILCLDVLRQCSANNREHQAQKVPNVLQFDTEPVCDGRTLARPVNYGVVRIVPRPGTLTDRAKPPVIVVDPRAGHGPGIGGMKHDSQIGVALAAGHPCYFVGFTPTPMPGQTVEDVCRAEAEFVEHVAARHPEAEGKPIIIANYQAGWQIMMMAALRPERADTAGRLALVLLGGRARQEPGALQRRHAGRCLADRAGRRPGRGPFRWREPRCQFRSAQSGQHAVEEAVQRLCECRHRGRAVPGPRPPDKRISLARFKQMAREQFLLVYLHPERAVDSLPSMLGDDPAEREAALEVVHRVLAARGDLSVESKRRLARVESLFGVQKKRRSRPEQVNA